MYRVVHHNVRLVPQRTDKTCWYACLVMIVRHYRRYLELREGVFYRILSGDAAVQKCSVGADIDTPEVAKRFEGSTFEPAMMLKASGMEEIAEAAHLQAEHIRLTPAEFSRVLHDAGPFLYGGRCKGYRGVSGGAHAVVITGIKGPEYGAVLEVNDPGPTDKGARLVKAFGPFIRSLPAFKDAEGKAVIVHV
jgi:hypothetical protein